MLLTLLRLLPFNANELLLKQITCVVNGTSVADRKLCEETTFYPITVGFPACQKVLLEFTRKFISYDGGLTLRYRVGDNGKTQCFLHPIIIIKDIT